MTMNDLQELSKLGPTVVVVAMFLLFLLKKQVADDKQRQHTETIIETHIKENTKGMNNMANTIKDLTGMIERMEERLTEQAEVIKKLYEENLKKFKRIKTLTDAN